MARGNTGGDALVGPGNVPATAPSTEAAANGTSTDGEVQSGVSYEDAMNVASDYWNNYGANAFGQYQQMGQGVNQQLSGLAGQSANMGAYYASGLSGAGNAYGQSLTNAGANYGNTLQQTGQYYGGALEGAAGQASAYGQQQGANVTGLGAQQGANLSNFGAQLAAQAQAPRAAAANPNFGAQNSSLANAANYGSALAGIENTAGPSAAQAQLQSGLNQSQAANLAMARSGRGWGGSAAALRGAATQNAAAGQQAVNQSAILRAQEDAAQRQRAAANLGQAAGIQGNLASQQFGQQQLGADVGLRQQAQNDAYQNALYGQAAGLMGQGANVALQGATSGAGIGQQGYGQQLSGLQSAAGAQLGAQQGAGELGLRGMESGANATLQGNVAANNAMLGGLAQAGNQYVQGFGSQLSAEQAAGSVYGAYNQQQQQALINDLTEYGIQSGVAAQQAASNNQLLAAGLGAGASLLTSLIPGVGPVAAGPVGAATSYEVNQATKSDERAKTDIAPAESKTLELLDKAPGYTYRYKDPADGDGKYLGPMAQDLEKSELGASMVLTDPQGVKRVDGARAGLAALGGLSVLKREFESNLERLQREIDALGGKRRKRAA